MLVLDQSSHYHNQNNYFFQYQMYFMIQFSSDFAYKNENGFLAILLNVYNIIHCYVSLFIYFFSLFFVTWLTEILETKIFTCSFQYPYITYALYFICLKKSYDPMTSLSISLPSRVAPALITIWVGKIFCHFGFKKKGGVRFSMQRSKEWPFIKNKYHIC
jgi:hypothetical protein